MTKYTWKGVSGDWNTASNWTPAGGPPKKRDDAIINGSATDTVTVDTSDVAKLLTLSDANATLNDDGPSASLTIGGTFTMSNGTFDISHYGEEGVLTAGALKLSGGALTVYSGGQLNLNGTLSQAGGTLTLHGGTISGGTIKSTAGTLAFDGSTLSDVIFDGPLNLTTDLSSVHLATGTTVVGSSGSGPGTINVTGDGATLDFDNTQTISNATINLGHVEYTQTVGNATINLGNTTGYASLEEYDTAGAGGQVLTLASGVTVDAQGYAQIDGSGYSGDGIVNEGAIDVTGGGDLNIASNNFTNEGTIRVEDSVEDIEPTTFTTTAASVIKIEGDSYLTIDPTNPWTNLGSITLASGASLYLYGTVSAASLGTISNSGGTVYIGGTWNNSGLTLNGSASFGELALYGGTISGGTVTSAGLAFSSGTLSGVTYDGPLNLTAFGQAVDLASGTTVVGPSGSGPGTINDTGNSSELFFDNAQTVSNDTINLGTTSAFYSSFLFDNDTAGAGDQVLTLASSVTVDVAGTAYIGSGDSPGDGIVTKGVIDQTGRSGGLLISGNAFTNSGTIDAKAADGYLDIDPTTFINSGKIHVVNGDIVRIEPTVTGKGTDTISGDSTLEFDAGVSSARTLGDQDIDFTGGGTLHLLAPKSFYGEISDFGTGDTVELLGSWHFSAISHSGDVTTLTLAKRSTTHAFEFAGDYTRSDFSITPGTITTVKYA